MSTTLSRPTFRRTTGEEYPQMNAIFGTGKDGPGVISSPTSLTRDMYYTTLTVSSDLYTQGYRVFATQYIKITSPGQIINSGQPGNNTDPIGPLQGGQGAYQVSYDTTIGLIRGGGEGGAGQQFTGTDGEAIVGIGGGGGGGGGNFAGGGIGGTSSVAATSGGGPGTGSGFHPIRSPFHSALMLGITNSLKVGGGGGGGGGGGEDIFGAGIGGNGGGGGGIVLLITPKVIGNGSILAMGGDGVLAPDPGTGGGGGGGGGGAIVLITKAPYQSTLTLNVNGGTGAQGPVAQASDGGVGSIINVVIQ